MGMEGGGHGQSARDRRFALLSSSKRTGILKGNDKRHHLNICIAHSQNECKVINHRNVGTDIAMDRSCRGNDLSLRIENVNRHHLLGQSPVRVVFRFTANERMIDETRSALTKRCGFLQVTSAVQHN